MVEVTVLHQSFAILHQRRTKLAGINAVFAPTADAVRYANDVGGIRLQFHGGRAGGDVDGLAVAPIIDVSGHEVRVIADLTWKGNS